MSLLFLLLGSTDPSLNGDRVILKASGLMNKKLNRVLCTFVLNRMFALFLNGK